MLQQLHLNHDKSIAIDTLISVKYFKNRFKKSLKKNILNNKFALEN